LLSVALSRGSPRVGVTHHPALWSPDFPRTPPPRGNGRDRPAGSVVHRGARTAIHLRLTLPSASSGLPGSSGGPPSNAPCLTLLRVGFAEPPESPRALVVSYTAVSPLPVTPLDAAGGLLSVALSRGSPRVGVTHHLALWSPDFPRTPLPKRQRSRPGAVRCAFYRAPPITRTSR
jgi:hypothetical protein